MRAPRRERLTSPDDWSGDICPGLVRIPLCGTIKGQALYCSAPRGRGGCGDAAQGGSMTKVGPFRGRAAKVRRGADPEQIR